MEAIDRAFQTPAVQVGLTVFDITLSTKSLIECRHKSDKRVIAYTVCYFTASAIGVVTLFKNIKGANTATYLFYGTGTAIRLWTEGDEFIPQLTCVLEAVACTLALHQGDSSPASTALSLGSTIISHVWRES